MFFWQKKRAAQDAEREREIRSIRLDTQKKLKKASDTMDKAKEQIDRLLGDDPAENIYYATGGGRGRR